MCWNYSIQHFNFEIMSSKCFTQTNLHSLSWCVHTLTTIKCFFMPFSAIHSTALRSSNGFVCFTAWSERPVFKVLLWKLHLSPLFIEQMWIQWRWSLRETIILYSVKWVLSQVELEFYGCVKQKFTITIRSTKRSNVVVFPFDSQHSFNILHV